MEGSEAIRVGVIARGAVVSLVTVPCAQASSKRAESQAAQQGAEQAEAQNQQAVDTFKNAAAVCLEGRGYTVR